MKTGDIILIPFPFAETVNSKIRPATVVSVTKDKYKDVIVCAISSVVAEKLSENEILIAPQSSNKLRAPSVLKVDRIVTLKRKDVVHQLGKLNAAELKNFKEIFRKLVE
jgi:mRNA interferase MazF